MSVCERCGRKGTRGFVILRGKGLRYGGDEQLICASRAACDRRIKRMGSIDVLFDLSRKL